MSVIKKPVITEKMSRLQEEADKYTFEVDLNATKPEIKKAVEATYPGVKVAKVNTAIMPSKPKGRYTRSGYQGGRTKLWKKAIVTIKEGEIDFFAEI
ncbi:50S ribosomal protein L23 [Gracilimonas mengyeensis]|uniref:Large ribosomal subunit protein uL23 n=1 Tax=Gracilimonas mengyeensis TaxID=1302730 RepID=A0A521FMS3_9BACT|nr:50S ribosomal protein L23 [Gracilimonas mengyeensis]SMO97424.1 LSU ribosomal protein L23P [Gracilimonas mengyeensis]